MKFICPGCTGEMNILSDPPENMRVCPLCFVVQWEENGKMETHSPQASKPIED